MQNHSTFLLVLGCVCLLAGACDRRPEEGESEATRTIEQGLKQAGQAIERGADKAGEALQRGVDKARPTVERGVDEMGEMIEQGAKKAGPALEQGVKDLGQAIERGVDKTSGALAAPAEKPQARASFDETGPGTKLDGEASFYERDGKVRVVVSIHDAPPGFHGIHIHEKGDCSDLKAKSMGAHFDPKQHQHGLPGASQRHLGDLGNIEIDRDGKGELEISVPDATLKSDGSTSFVGRAIIIHGRKDDGTGKSGNSGDAIACGVIKSI